MSIRFELVPEELHLRDTLFVGAFLGFPDASMGASGAVRFLVESLRAAPLATWDGDEYYDFAELRPVSRVVPPRDRTLIWPEAEFWVVREAPLARGAADAPPQTRSLVLFLAPEPRLRWRTYGKELVALAQRCGVAQAAFFGSAWADVPHTRPPIVTGWATEPRLRTRLETIGIPFSGYQGPSSYQSAAIEAFREAGVGCVSLFSNGPHYLPLPNANLSHALLRRLGAALRLDLNLAPLKEAGEALVEQANAAMEGRVEFREHVRQLEDQFDSRGEALAPGQVQREAAARAQEESAPLNVDPADLVRGVEDFLRRRVREQQEPDAGDQDADDGAGNGGRRPGDGPPGPEPGSGQVGPAEPPEHPGPSE